MYLLHSYVDWKLTSVIMMYQPSSFLCGLEVNKRDNDVSDFGDYINDSSSLCLLLSLEDIDAVVSSSSSFSSAILSFSINCDNDTRFEIRRIPVSSSFIKRWAIESSSIIAFVVFIDDVRLLLLLLLLWLPRGAPTFI